MQAACIQNSANKAVAHMEASAVSAASAIDKAIFTAGHLAEGRRVDLAEILKRAT